MSFPNVIGRITRTDSQGRVLRVVYLLEGREIASKEYDDKSNLLAKTGQLPPDCNVAVYRPGGTIMEDYALRAGQTHGRYRYYREDGGIFYDVEFCNGLKHGANRSF